MSFTLTAAQVKAIGGRNAKRVDELVAAFNEHAPKFGLNVEHRAEHFLAQLAHESGGFQWYKEIWGPTSAQLSYEGRKTLGNTQPGDGKRFMGRGPIQITGRYNYTEFTKWCRKHYPDCPDFVAHPAELEKMPWALIAAFWYWDSRNLNAEADQNDFETITRKINGGTNGIVDRRYRLGLAVRALVTDGPKPAPAPGADPRKRPVLRKGAKGEFVNELQTKLGITVDGDFGPITHASVMTFQREHNLLPDGVVGSLTWAELDKNSAS